MTDLLYLDENYLKEFQARVTELTEDGVVLDRTAFYVGGGGQPSDTGLLLDRDQRYAVTGLARSDTRRSAPLPWRFTTMRQFE